jgi:uncharacterized membrane protein
MAKTVVGLFDDFSTAQKVVRELQDNGFSRDDISLVANDARGEFSKQLGKGTGRAQEDVSQGAAAGAGTGAVLGGLGGLLVGLGALAIPGIGPVIAAGPLAAALAGAGIGAAAGGMVGALVDLGIPDQEAQFYNESVRRGGTLVIVRTSEAMADRASSVMKRFNPVDMKRREQDWRTSGWHGYGTEPAGTTTTRSTTMSDFDTFEPRFRQHYSTAFTNSGYSYDRFQPAYRYGYDIANEERFRNRRWNDIEMEARRDWERRHPDSAWEDFKDAVRAGWESIRS